MPLLPLALQHLELLLVVQRPLQLLLGRAQAGEDQPQRVAPRRRRAPASRRLSSLLDPRDQRHPGIPLDLPAEDVPVQVEDRLPAARADVDDDAVVVEPGLLRGVRDELEHALRLVRRELADVAERLDVALGDDEQVRVGLRVDVARSRRSRRPVRTWSPSRVRACRRGSQSGTDDPLLRRPPRARTRTSSPTGRVDEPGRVVVAVAAAGAVDEHHVLAPSFARQRRRQASCESARSRALRSLLHRRRHRVVARRSPSRAAASTGRRAPS